jgi:hypothetical protein
MSIEKVILSEIKNIILDNQSIVVFPSIINREWNATAIHNHRIII